MQVQLLLNKHVNLLNFENNKHGFMAKLKNYELYLDAKAILQRAPKLIINNIDSVKQILPREKIYINAFGVVQQDTQFDLIPPDFEYVLDIFQHNLKYLKELKFKECESLDEEEPIKLQLLTTLLEQHQHEHLGDISTFFGAYFKNNQHGSVQGVIGPQNTSKSGANFNSRGNKSEIMLQNDEAIGQCHFRIRFCPFKNKYLIKDMGDGSGTFIRIEEATVL